MPEPHVVVLIATYRRAALLRQALAALQKSPVRQTAVVVDNADDPATAETVAAFTSFTAFAAGTDGASAPSGPPTETTTGAATPRFDAVRLVPGQNLGCGGGLAHGERWALEHCPQATHFWILDDDAEVSPATLATLLAAMAQTDAWAAYPMVEGPEGRVGWFPGLLEKRAFRVVKRRGIAPADYLREGGPAPVPFSWAPGVALLCAREALEAVGLHRAEFWIRGEDLEFSLRITHRHRGVFVPTARVVHWSYALPETAEARAAECLKTAAMLRNIAAIAPRLPHARRLLPFLPGNLWGFLRLFGLRRSVRHALPALWQGGVMNRPAGVPPLLFPQGPAGGGGKG